jgi:hypothetical protein
LDFICSHQTARQKQQWTASLQLLHSGTDSQELEITSQGSSFHVIVGSHRYGNYICIPNHDIGCELASLSDVFWNREQLSRQKLNHKDAAAIAYGLKQLASL